MVGKYSKNKKTPILPVILILMILVVLAGALAVKYLPAKTGEKASVKVETGFCDLYYPSQWQNYMKIQQENNTVRFRAEIEDCEAKPLFDVHFDSEEGSRLGTVQTADGREVSVSLSLYSHEVYADWSAEEMDILYEMQECINYLCESLPLLETVPVPEAPTEPEYEDIEISTSYGLLRYPGKWEEYLQTNMEAGDVCVVEFYAKVGAHSEVHLFDVLMSKNVTGEVVLRTEDGNVYSMDLEFRMEELDTTWTEQESDIVYGMLDDANYLLESFSANASIG